LIYDSKNYRNCIINRQLISITVGTVWKEMVPQALSNYVTNGALGITVGDAVCRVSGVDYVLDVWDYWITSLV
jgi:hypothetical protein